jgi:hypothetical protein
VRLEYHAGSQALPARLASVKRRLPALVVFAVAVAGWWALTLPTAAQAVGACLSDPIPSGPHHDPSTVTFLGTVADTQHSEQNALIHVEEIWYGGSLPEYVAAVQVDPNVLDYYAVLFRPGDRYLLRGQGDGDLVRVTCSSIWPYSGWMEERAPTQVMEPLPAQRPIVWGVHAPVAQPWLLLIGLVMLDVAVVLYAGSRRISSMRSPVFREYAAIVALVGFIVIVSQFFFGVTTSQIIT